MWHTGHKTAILLTVIKGSTKSTKIHPSKSFISENLETVRNSTAKNIPENKLHLI